MVSYHIWSDMLSISLSRSLTAWTSNLSVHHCNGQLICGGVLQPLCWEQDPASLWRWKGMFMFSVSVSLHFPVWSICSVLLFEKGFVGNIGDRDGNTWSPSSCRHKVKCNALHWNEPHSLCDPYPFTVWFVVCLSLSLSAIAQCIPGPAHKGRWWTSPSIGNQWGPGEVPMDRSADPFGSTLDFE